MAFRICCNAKRGIKCRESYIFHKVFPKTQLLGFEVNGEFGWNSFELPEEEEQEEEIGKICFKCC